MSSDTSEDKRNACDGQACAHQIAQLTKQVEQLTMRCRQLEEQAARSWLDNMPQETEPTVAATLFDAANSIQCLLERAASFKYDPRSGCLYEEGSPYYFQPRHLLFYDSEQQLYLTEAEVEPGLEAKMDGAQAVDTSRQYTFHSYAYDPLAVAQVAEATAKGASAALGTDESSRGDVRCMSLVVTESTVLPIGSCVAISVQGIVLGRDPEEDGIVCIPHHELSRHHCEITYQPDLNSSWPFVITDTSSMNGTFVNGDRLSQARQQSTPRALRHLDQIKFGTDTIVTAHVHAGDDYCMDCRNAWHAAATIQSETDPESKGLHGYVPGESLKEKSHEHRKQMSKLKRSMGLFGSTAAPDTDQYTDRAELRRQTVGSDPFLPEMEGVEAADVNTPIASSSIGHALLRKMGWVEGTSLGKREDAVKEPVKVQVAIFYLVLWQYGAIQTRVLGSVHVDMGERHHAREHMHVCECRYWLVCSLAFCTGTHSPSYTVPGLL
eukprot:m.148359 g.148359  ORF g.148359 m.148359 type:complete len:494 (-) comp14177_c0_seq1:784-2265(-)